MCKLSLVVAGYSSRALNSEISENVVRRRREVTGPRVAPWLLGGSNPA